ncbi:hypothetical protein BLOT_015135, partial [Blomia tropicalis]
ISGDLKSNNYVIETLFEIIKNLRLHMAMKLTKDNFRCLTVQFSDHYYKVDLSSPENSVVHKYRLRTSSVNA